MPIRNQHWYNLNEGREYPLDASASSMTDDSKQLPSNIITDIQVRYPETLGAYPFVSAVSVTDTLITITLQASDYLVAPDPTDLGFTPLAVVSIKKNSFVEGRQYQLLPQYPGVGGWVTFGSGASDDTLFTGRFSQPSQALFPPSPNLLQTRSLLVLLLFWAPLLWR